MPRSAIIVLLLTLQLTHGAIPRLFEETDFTSTSFAEAVNHFVTLGDEAAVQELRGLAKESFADDIKHGFSFNERIGWMCRVLFEAKGEALRPPMFGALRLPYHTMPEKNWPLYPVALSGSTYFVLSQGYSVAGMPEDPKAYIQYCRLKGVFRKKPIAVPTKAQSLADAAALRRSAEWQAIKWIDSGENWSYALDEKAAWEFIQKQAEGR